MKFWEYSLRKNTIYWNGISKSGATYPSGNFNERSKRGLEWYSGAGDSYIVDLEFQV